MIWEHKGLDFGTGFCWFNMVV